jgi:hypothetical protein
MWYTVALGVLINMIFLWLSPVGRTRFVFHRDHNLRDRDSRHPVRGEIGVSPEALQLVYRQMQQD